VNHANAAPVISFFNSLLVPADGVWTTKATKTELEDHQDSYAGECAM